MEPVIHSMVEHTHLSEMQEDLARKLQESRRKDVGRLDSLRGSILSFVVGESYERANEEMVAYVDLKTSYPGFQESAKRLVQHCTELIQAIQTKRNFPGLGALSLAKQQEIHEKVMEHFEDLKYHLKQIEKIEREHKLDDVRSTVWVMRALCQAVAAVVIVAFVMEVKTLGVSSIVNVTDGYVDSISTWVVTLIKI